MLAERESAIEVPHRSKIRVAAVAEKPLCQARIEIYISSLVGIEGKRAGRRISITGAADDFVNIP